MSNDQRRIRLGDVVDDYCPRCRLIMNHGVVGMVEGEIRKVRCNTCQSEHDFRHGRLPKARKSATNKLFEEVLKGMPGSSPQEQPEEAPKPAPAPAHPQRRLYTIRRAISDKNSGKRSGGGS